jgi:4-hydroxybenzoate polyprenyltransferase
MVPRQAARRGRVFGTVGVSPWGVTTTLEQPTPSKSKTPSTPPKKVDPVVPPPEPSDSGPIEREPTPSMRVEARRKSLIKGLVKSIRPHQWVKNVFVMAPLVFAKDLIQSNAAGEPTLRLDVTGKALVGTFVFCLLAGAVYTINDLVDVEADRIHPVKRNRPIASGAVPEKLAKPFAAVLVLVALALAVKLNLAFAAVAGIYFVENILYSFKLKKVAFLDVSLISAGFVLRVLAGGYATGIHVSWYMIACTALVALFLGFGKRRHELEGATAGKQRAALEAYTKTSLNIALAITGIATAATYTAYTFAPDTREFFKTDWLWLTIPNTVFGLGRFLMIVSGRAGRGRKAESPTQEMLRDVPFVVNLILWAIIVLALVYRLRPGT